MLADLCLYNLYTYYTLATKANTQYVQAYSKNIRTHKQTNTNTHTHILTHIHTHQIAKSKKKSKNKKPLRNVRFFNFLMK